MEKRLVLMLACLLVVFCALSTGCRKLGPTKGSAKSGASSASASSPSLGGHFSGEGVSFDYPGDWTAWDPDSFSQMKDALKSRREIDLVAIFLAPNDTGQMQVTRQPSRASLTAVYTANKEIAKQIRTKKNISKRYDTYSVQIARLSGGLKAVLGRAWRNSGETWLSYQLFVAGMEYDADFYYGTAEEAARGERLRQAIMKTFRIQPSSGPS